MLLLFRISIFLISFFPAYIGAAQTVDTVKVTFTQVEEIFLRNNYSLLAQRYNITASEGAIRQARLWNNPLFFIESNLYDPVNGKFFNYGPINTGAKTGRQFSVGGQETREWHAQCSVESIAVIGG
jgi:hypothetical protein